MARMKHPHPPGHDNPIDLERDRHQQVMGLERKAECRCCPGDSDERPGDLGSDAAQSHQREVGQGQDHEEVLALEVSGRMAVRIRPVMTIR